MAEKRNGRDQEIAYGRLDDDARHIMEHVEGLIEACVEDPDVGTVRGTLEQICEAAFERNVSKRVAKDRVRELTETFTHPESVVRVDILLLLDKRGVPAAARRLQMVLDDLYQHDRISMQTWERTEMELRELSWKV